VQLRKNKAAAPTARPPRRVLALLAVGAVHVQQYLGADYKAIPTIGPLFLLNAIGAGVVGLTHIAPVHRVMDARRADLAVGLLSVVVVAIAIGSLVALYISETGTLFGLPRTGMAPRLSSPSSRRSRRCCCSGLWQAISTRRARSDHRPRHTADTWRRRSLQNRPSAD
jgi:hypothetical protein